MVYLVFTGAFDCFSSDSIGGLGTADKSGIGEFYYEENHSFSKLH